MSVPQPYLYISKDSRETKSCTACNLNSRLPMGDNTGDLNISEGSASSLIF
jgi:hypothetical protein